MNAKTKRIFMQLHMDTWLPKQFIVIDVIILNTTGVSNDSVPSHEVQANVFLFNWLIIVHSIGIFSAIPVSNPLVVLWGLHNLQVSVSVEAWHDMTDPEIRPKKQFWDNNAI